MNDRDSSAPIRSASSPPNGPQDAIAQSVAARDSSRAMRLQRTLETLLALARTNPPTTSTQFAQLLNTILDALLVATEASKGNLQLFDPLSSSLRIRVHRGFQRPFLDFFAEVHDGAACSAAFAQGKPVVVDDVLTSPLFTPDSRRVVLEAGVRAVQSLALVSDGKKLGAVSVHYPSPGIQEHKREAFASSAPLIARLVEAGLRTH